MWHANMLSKRVQIWLQTVVLTFKLTYTWPFRPREPLIQFPAFPGGESVRGDGALLFSPFAALWLGKFFTAAPAQRFCVKPVLPFALRSRVAEREHH